MLSAQKIEANRSNAQVSTGPRTAAGKAALSENARFHGLSSRHLFVPEERAPEFDSLTEALCLEAATSYDRGMPRLPLEDRHDPQRLGTWLVQNQVVSHRPKQEVGVFGKVFSDVPGASRGSQQPEGLCELRKQLTGDTLACFLCMKTSPSTPSPRRDSLRP